MRRAFATVLGSAIAFALPLAFGCSSFGDVETTPESEAGADAPATTEAGTDANSVTDAPADASADPSLLMFLRFDENIGRVASDLSSHHNDAGLRETAAWTSGQTGSALLLDGATAYAEVVPKGGASFAKGFTFAAWLKVDDLPYDQCLFTREGAFVVKLFGRRVQVINVGGNNNFSLSAAAVPAAAWHHLAVTFGNGEIHVFIDGSETGVDTRAEALVPLAETTTSLTIGKDGLACRSAKGAFDDLRVYTRTLPSAEITALAK